MQHTAKNRAENAHLKLSGKTDLLINGYTPERREVMDCQYAKDYYKVPACIGRRVIVNGDPGIIAEDRGHYIGVNFDSDKPGVILNCHPTWKVEYLGMGKIRKMTRSQRRYQEYLRVGDCYDSFAHFLRSGA